MATGDELLHRLAECHKPETMPYAPDGDPIPGWSSMQCKACDGVLWWIVAPGDEPRECALWLEYRARVNS